MIPLLLRRPALVFALDCLTALTIGWTALLAPGYAREIVSTFTQSDAGLGLFYLLSALGYVGGSLFAGWLTERLGRRVVFVNADDLRELGFADGDYVDIVSEWHDGERRADHFRVVEYQTARGCAAAYFPEANILVPLDSVADRSRTPVSKAIVIRLEPTGVEHPG